MNKIKPSAGILSLCDISFSCYLAAYFNHMKRTTLERNIAGLLFVVVLVTFSFAQRDSKKMEKAYSATEVVQKRSLASQLPSQPAAENNNLHN